MHEDVPAHQAGETARNGEAKAGAAEFPRRRTVGLAEGLEQARAGHGVHADAGVGHLDRDAHRPVRLGSSGEHDLDDAFAGELHCVRNEIGDALAHAHRIETQAETGRQRAGEDETDILLLGRGREQRMDLADRVQRAGVDRCDLKSARLDLGQVEHVVEDGHQVGAGLADGGDHCARLGIEIALLERLRHAEHAVERRADLMAHVGEEFALGAGGRLGGVARGFEFAQTLGALLGQLGLGGLDASGLVDEDEAEGRRHAERDRRCDERRIDLARLQEDHIVDQVIDQQDDHKNDRREGRGLADLCGDHANGHLAPAGRHGTKR